MRRTMFALFACTLVAGQAAAQELPKPAAPTKESEWLKPFVGEWEVEMESLAVAGMPAMKCKGTFSARAIGNQWIVADSVADPGGVKMVAVLTVGYDPAKKKYVGSWVDSMQTHMWIYEGTVSEDGKTISLLADGPGFADPAKTAKYKDAWEFKSKDHLVLTASVLGDDGKWTTFMTANYKRKK